MRCGVDIGGTNTVVGLVNDEGKVIDHDNIKTAYFEDAADLVLTISYTILRMAKVNHIDRKQIESIGVGCPNINPFDGTVENATNMKFKKKVSLLNLFRQYFPETPLFFDNDANAATKGEMIYGSAKGLKDFIYITLGTGLGSGIVSNGKLVYGCNGKAGEIGHMIVNHTGRKCGCGRKGCLEQYISAQGLYRSYLELCEEKGLKPQASDYKEMTALAKQNDPIALQVYETGGEILGRALANVACVTAPSHIFIFGGVAQVGEIFIRAIEKYFRTNLLFCYDNQIRIELSGLMKSDRYASILGAAALAF